MQQMGAIGGRSLGKDCDVFSLAEDFSDFLIDDPGVAAATATQEYRVVLRGEPADQRPMPHLFLGNEGRRQDRVDDVDVDPGNVVGDDQGARYGMRQIGLDLDAQRIEQRDRPTRFQPPPRRLATDRENAEDDQGPAGDQQGQTKQPEGANQEGGLVQSACPR